MVEIINITPDLIEELLSCEKRIVSDPSPRNKTNGQHTQTDALLESIDKKHRFMIFIREHISLIEFFSVGLVYMPDDATSIILARYNGDHGDHLNKLTGEVIIGFHIHSFSVDAIGKGLKGENPASTTTRYASASQALIALSEDVHIMNFRDYFSDKLQTELFTWLILNKN